MPCGGYTTSRVVIWETTVACDFRCLHCEVAAGTRRADELDTEEALAVCDALAALGCEQCNISGGEPLLRRDWPLLCERLSSRGIRVHLISNGSLVDAETVSRGRLRRRRLALSFDGLRSTHNRVRVWKGGESAFAAVVAAAHEVRRGKLALAAIARINRWNLGELEALHALLRELDADLWQVQLGLPLGRLRESRRPTWWSPPSCPIWPSGSAR